MCRKAWGGIRVGAGCLRVWQDGEGELEMDGVVGFWVRGLRSVDWGGFLLLGGVVEGGFSPDMEQAPGLWAFAIFGYRVRFHHPG